MRATKKWKRAKTLVFVRCVVFGGAFGGCVTAAVRLCCAGVTVCDDDCVRIASKR